MDTPRFLHAGTDALLAPDATADRAAASPSPTSQRLLEKFQAIRAKSCEIAAPLSAEDCQVQSMPDASPIKWHLAHTTWFFETFLLADFDSAFEPFSPEFKVLFNSYYNAVGEKHPRAQRGLLTRPPLSKVLEYRQSVDARLLRLAPRLTQAQRSAFDSLLELGLNHEQQHQELMLTDLKHMLSCNPLKPAYIERPSGDQPAAGGTRVAAPIEWIAFSGGIADIGHEGAGFAFDNESPRHQVLLEPYLLADRLVTQGEYLDFINDGGYTKPEFWLSAGWDMVRSAQWHAPLYWEQRDGEWVHFTLFGMCPLDPNAPVAHVSYFEADAYARWAGARLPREAEWERAAPGLVHATEGNMLESASWRPLPVRGDDGPGLKQCYGDVWEWTASGYEPYPRFKSAPGAVGEYNGKFMCNQYVLRGGSCVTPATHIRATYRNFFPADARWQFSGIRLARDS